ncbi:ABC transporter substrate-binding protein [Microbacterium tenebrionis]|uniref:ABC transporter substrate-binding protein n=1 Tax=Microbacterium tenebrionis TaxID=2830665 RepID=UPI00158F3FE3|nr:ABC transporter substrate-binding protein [Microbacterium ihumii]
MSRTRTLAVAALAASALVLTACSGGSLSGEEPSSAPSGGSSGDLTPVTVGLLPIAPAAAVQLGIDEGIFEKHGLDVTVQSGQGGAALLPAVSSQSIEFAVGNPLSVLVAVSQGLGMEIIAGYSAITTPEPSGIVVMEDSGIDTWADLEGKTVALNAVNTQGDLGTMAMVEADGGDPSKVSFTEIPFPDQLAQLEQGHIDASWTPEPFLTASLETPGVKWLGDPLTAIDDLYTMVTFTSTAYADANPEVTDAFAAAIAESTALAMDDDELYRQAIVDYTGMDAEVVANIRLEALSGDLDPSIIEELSATALKYGFLDTEPDMDAVIRK